MVISQPYVLMRILMGTRQMGQAVSRSPQAPHVWWPHWNTSPLRASQHTGHSRSRSATACKHARASRHAQQRQVKVALGSG